MEPLSVMFGLAGGAALLLPDGTRAATRLLRVNGPPAKGRTVLTVVSTRLRGPAGWVVVAGVLAFAAGGWPGGVPLSLATGAAVYGVARALARRRTSRRPVGSMRLAAGWDLLAACLRAGMPVPAAVRAIAAGAPDDAATSLRATADLLALGAAPEEAWAPARSSPVTAELARAACRTARSGSALAEVASALAERVRASTGDAAEARAQRAAVLITGPLGLCFLPAFLCLGVVPVVLGLAGQLTVMR